MNITGYTVEKIIDPTGILEGDRYEFFINIEVDKDDELYSERGVILRVIFASMENTEKIVQYQFIENETNEVLNFEMEEDEMKMITQFCKEHIK
jgi:Family of unknown function (DUF6509)